MALAKVGLDGPEGALSSPEQLAQLIDLTLPGAAKAAASYAVASASLSQPDSSGAWQLGVGTLEEVIRWEPACGCCLGAGAVNGVGSD